MIQLLEDLAHKIHNRLGLRMHRLAVASWEIRLKVDLLGKIDGSWRVVVTNPTGHTCIVQVIYPSLWGGVLLLNIDVAYSSAMLS